MDFLVFLLLVAFALAIGLLKSSRRSSSRRNWTGDRREPWIGAANQEVLDTSRWSLDLLKALEWKRFELVCAAYFETLGFRARTTRAGADGGIDIHLFSENNSRPSMVVQCKAWNAYSVGIKPVRELYGVMAREGVSEGIFLTTGQFTQEARRFPKGNEMHLWDGQTFLRKINELAPNQQEMLLRVATDGDFTTPTCPSCGIKMVTRTSRRDGKEFWGCLNYPRCKQTFN